jgi:hypothetical protein
VKAGGAEEKVKSRGRCTHPPTMFFGSVEMIGL